MGDNVTIGLCDFSLGAAIMALLIDYDIHSVVGLSPVVNLNHDFGYQHKELIELMLAKPSNDNEPIKYDLGW